MSSGYKIHVSGLSPDTTEAKLNDFFSFCGKLVSVTKTEKSAELVFEKESASRTALMLNGGTLDGAHLEVTSAASVPPASASTSLPAAVSGSTPIGATELEQEDKPKAGIVAEYLAHGYILGDHIVQRAIDTDQKHGISHRFLSFIDNLDKKVGATVVGPEKTVSGKLTEGVHTAFEKGKEVDQNRGISRKGGDYYSKVIGTPVGQKVLSFYTSTQKQVVDVHEEAKRIAAAKKAATSPSTPTSAVDPSITPIATTTATDSTLPHTTATPPVTSPTLTQQATALGHTLLGKVEQATGTGAAVPGGKPLIQQAGEVVGKAQVMAGNAVDSLGKTLGSSGMTGAGAPHM